MRADLERILAHLDSHKIRATYTAVAEALGVIPRSVGALLVERNHRASWVVAKDTKLPTDYTAEQRHPDLESRPEVLEDGVSLLRAMLGFGRRGEEPRPL